MADSEALPHQSAHDPQVGDRARLRWRGMNGSLNTDVGELQEHTSVGVMLRRDTDGHLDHLWVPGDYVLGVERDG
jgi:hypothetical protein